MQKLTNLESRINMTRYPVPATRHPLPATRYPVPATRTRVFHHAQVECCLITQTLVQKLDGLG